jgi:hypothetical protein
VARLFILSLSLLLLLPPSFFSFSFPAFFLFSYPAGWCVQVVFIATANTTSSISRPLLDRMELIELPGYTQPEKVAIARRHLLPRLMEEHKLADEVGF